MLARWTVRYGPEYAESVKALAVSPARTKLHMASIEVAIERDPYAYSEPFAGESHRVFQSDDFHDGVRLIAFVVLDPRRLAAEIKWVETRPASTEDDEEDEGR